MCVCEREKVRCGCVSEDWRCTWHDSFIRDMTYSYVIWLIYTWHDSFICDMTHSYVTRPVHIWHESFIRDTRYTRLERTILCGADSNNFVEKALQTSGFFLEKSPIDTQSSLTIGANDALWSRPKQLCRKSPANIGFFLEKSPINTQGSLTLATRDFDEMSGFFLWKTPTNVGFFFGKRLYQLRVLWHLQSEISMKCRVSFLERTRNVEFFLKKSPFSKRTVFFLNIRLFDNRVLRLQKKFSNVSQLVDKLTTQKDFSPWFSKRAL